MASRRTPSELQEMLEDGRLEEVWQERVTPPPASTGTGLTVPVTSHGATVGGGEDDGVIKAGLGRRRRRGKRERDERREGTKLGVA